MPAGALRAMGKTAGLLASLFTTILLSHVLLKSFLCSNRIEARGIGTLNIAGAGAKDKRGT